MLTTGLVLDVYDDHSGSTFREIYGSPEEVPALVKSASVKTERLPDDVFALVMIDGEEKYRKFACVDPGNTILSMEYFARTGDQLPKHAQEVALENFKTACAWYDMELAPALVEKYAGMLGAVGNWAVNKAVKNPVGTLMGAVTGMGAINQAKQDITKNVSNLPKLAEVSGTPLMPNKGSSGEPIAKPIATINKTGGHGHLPGHSGEAPPDTFMTSETGEAPKAAPQMKAIQPYVDISRHEEAPRLVEKKAHYYALEGRYPLDDYEQVKMASSYFDTYGKLFDPDERHEYCVNLVKRAEQLALPVSDQVRRYGSTKYASAADIQTCLDLRRELVLDEGGRQLLDKIASQQLKMEPELFAATLEEFDKIAGIDEQYDRHVPDAYYSTFGFQKNASDVDEFSDTIGNMTVKGHELKNFGMTNFKQLEGTFGDDFAKEFQKDPIGIYSSLPVQQKKMIIRMAQENSPGNETLI